MRGQTLRYENITAIAQTTPTRIDALIFIQRVRLLVLTFVCSAAGNSDVPCPDSRETFGTISGTISNTVGDALVVPMKRYPRLGM